MNGLMLQGFEWYLPDDGCHYDRIKEKLDFLAGLGFTAIWLPPVCKATGPNDVGYGIYDLYDLGEFDQKGSVRTKYGTKEQLKGLIESCHEKGIAVYADVVLNHKAGADEVERFQACQVSCDNRNEIIGQPREIEAWTKFTFPGRRGKYSDFTWNYNHFSGVDYDQLSGSTGIYRIEGNNKGWSWSVDGEKGNFDYLMFADIDHNNGEVRKDIFNWAKWFIDELNVDGFRYDASKHIDSNFINDLNLYIQQNIKSDFYSFGEYWKSDLGQLENYMSETSGLIDLFDVPLHYNFNTASKMGCEFDMRKLFDNTIVKADPLIAVTFVDNHDTQEGQALESWVQPWFKQHAYAMILLRNDGYPTIFWGDLFGIGDCKMYPGMGDKLIKLLELRRDYAYGDQDDYFNDKNTVGFVRKGDGEHPGRIAVVMTNGDMATLSMFVGQDQAGKTYMDMLNNNDGKVTIKDDGFGDFFVSPGSVSAWVQRD